MASTYAPSDAFDYAKVLVKNMPLDDVKVDILDAAAKMLWHAAPWRWTVAAFPSITLANNTQDYTVAIPADFLYLQDAYLTNEDDDTPRHLVIVPTRAAGGKKGQPSEVSVTGSAGTNGTARFYPTIGTIKTGDTLKMLGRYKKICPNITNANVSTAGVHVFDDDWFWVYQSCVVYFAYRYADDQRAGGATYSSDGRWQFTGHRAICEAEIALMREREKLAPSTDRLVQEVKAK